MIHLQKRCILRRREFSKAKIFSMIALFFASEFSFTYCLRGTDRRVHRFSNQCAFPINSRLALNEQCRLYGLLHALHTCRLLVAMPFPEGFPVATGCRLLLYLIHLLKSSCLCHKEQYHRWSTLQNYTQYA